MRAHDDWRAVLEGRERWAVVEGDCLEVMPTLPAGMADHVLADPPYSEHVHAKNRRMLRGAGGTHVKKRKDGTWYRQCGLVPLDFPAITGTERALAAREFARLSRRWVVVFTNAEAQHAWEATLKSTSRARHIRVGAWVKIACQPQLTGDRPGTGIEVLEIAHGVGQRCRWNGGGRPAVWTHQIATDRNGTGDRVHTTQKPISLMIDLVSDFTDEGDLVLDSYAGSGTTGVACLRLGRRFIGIEKDAKYAAIARERLEAESQGLTLRAARAGQLPMFPGDA